MRLLYYLAAWLAHPFACLPRIVRSTAVWHYLECPVCGYRDWQRHSPGREMVDWCWLNAGEYLQRRQWRIDK